MKLGLKQKEWLKNLRGGLYHQGRGYLCRLTKQGYCEFCCLGILQDNFSDDDDKQLDDENIYEEYEGNYEFFSSKNNVSTVAVLLEETAEEYGFHSQVGRFYKDGSIYYHHIDGGECSSLAEMNDYGMTFEEIADFVEANPEKSFIRPSNAKGW